MEKPTLKPYDSANYLRTDADISAYLDAAEETNDPELIRQARETVARAKALHSVEN